MKAKRTLLAVALLSALLGGAAAGVQAAAVTTPVVTAGSAVGGTPIDWAIDASVSRMQLSPADQRIMREQLQMQFQSLDQAQRARVLAAAKDVRSEEGIARVLGALADGVRESARAIEAELRQPVSANAQGITPKLGADGDYVFVATAGPCRVYDSRFGPGQLAAGTARQAWVMSNGSGYSWAFDQGGTGSAGSGNCVGTVFSSPYPVSVVATVTVVNTTASGALQAWNGGTTLSGGAVVNWNAGDRLSNTTVIPMNRSITAYPGSGSKRDIGLNNNSGAAIDFVIDVVGYFIENQATALDCQTVFGTNTTVPANSSILIATPACPTGYTAVAAGTSLQDGLYSSTLQTAQCRLGNLTGTGKLGSCDIQCCRVPGR